MHSREMRFGRNECQFFNRDGRLESSDRTIIEWTQYVGTLPTKARLVEVRRL